MKVRCINSTGYAHSLIEGNVYKVINSGLFGEYTIIDEDNEEYSYSKGRFEVVDDSEANEIFSKLMNKEIKDGDMIIFPDETFTYKCGEIVNECGKDLTISKLYKATNVKFERKKHVTFEEALNSGKNIKYEHGCIYVRDYHCLSDILHFLTNNNSDEVVREILSSKCWLIEE